MLPGQEFSKPMSRTTSIEGFYRGFSLIVREGADGYWTATGRPEFSECGRDHVASERGPSPYTALESLRCLIDEMLNDPGRR
jgi:hypothetical protein